MQDAPALLDRLADAVEHALEDTPLDRYGDHGGMGASGSPAKHIDRMAEQAVLDRIEAEDAPVNLVSEEVGRVDRGHEYTLILDPVDGTTNCVRQIPFYCTSLAITAGRLRDVEHALVADLTTGERYRASLGQGATLD
ncbi:MAG: inositol monophosphatase family protein, partial [Candidatus Thermoplasmatota archaeon]|nr:inositol monophosphatase family protein [Candidatus Thermoplasmatota archaeon]